MGRVACAPDPPAAWARARARRAARRPPHTNGVGCRFHPRAVASSPSMICGGCVGCCPCRARRVRMRCTDSAGALWAGFNQLPPNGVYNGMIPCANSQTTNAGVLCPTRLSRTRSIRNGGGSAGRLTRTVSPSCHSAHCARHSSSVKTPADSGRVARIALSAS